MELGRRIVEYIIQEGNLQPFLTAGFTPEWLIDEKDMTRIVVFQDADLDAYRHILNHWQKYGQVPLPEVFEKSFPLVAYRREESDWTPDELIEQAYAKIKTDLVEQTLADLNELDIQESYDEALLTIKQAAERFDIPVTDLGFELAVQSQVRRLQVNEEAKQRVNGKDGWELPARMTLPDVQASPEKQDWRVDRLVGLKANILLNAQRKAGKSTLIINLIKSMREGTSFLSEFPVIHTAKSVHVFDLEMPLGTSKKWLDQAGMTRDENVTYSFLTGQVSRLSVMNDRHRGLIAESLRGVDVLIIDPLGPLIAAMGLEENSNTEIRSLLNALADLKYQAGVSELIVVHHTGHNAQSRARGASVLADWPDAVWNLRNPSPDKIWEDRKFSAYGRDVYIEETNVHMDRDTKLLTTREGVYQVTHTGYREQIRDALGDNARGFNDLFRASGIKGKETFKRELRDLENLGELMSYQDGNRVMYQLTV